MMDFLSFLKNPTFYIVIGALLILRSLALYCFRVWNDPDDDDNEELHVIRIPDPQHGIPAIRWLIREEGSRLSLGLRARRMAVYFVEERLPPLNLTSDTVFHYGSGRESGVKNLECAICLEEFVDGEECRLLPDCEHAYHRACIDKWLERKRLCPLCRAPVEGLVSDFAADVEYDIESGPLGSLQFVPSLF